MVDQHPGASVLRDFGLGRLVQDEWDKIEEHLASCQACCEVMENVDDDPLVMLARCFGQLESGSRYFRGRVDDGERYELDR